MPEVLADFINTPDLIEHNLNYQKVSREIELEAFNQNVKCPQLSKDFVEKENKQKFEGKLNGVVPLVLDLISFEIIPLREILQSFPLKTEG